MNEIQSDGHFYITFMSTILFIDYGFRHHVTIIFDLNLPVIYGQRAASRMFSLIRYDALKAIPFQIVGAGNTVG